MLEIADRLIADGVIPILSSVPPRDDNATADLEVPRYNAVVRGIAQALQVPFIDYHFSLLPLPKHGLGGDKLHPSAYVAGGRQTLCLHPRGAAAWLQCSQLVDPRSARSRQKGRRRQSSRPRPAEPSSRRRRITASTYFDQELPLYRPAQHGGEPLQKHQPLHGLQRDPRRVWRRVSLSLRAEEADQDPSLGI